MSSTYEPRIQSAALSLSAATAAFLGFLQTLPDETANTPLPGGWTPGGHAWHLALANEVFRDTFTGAGGLPTFDGVSDFTDETWSFNAPPLVGTPASMAPPAIVDSTAAGSKLTESTRELVRAIEAMTPERSALCVKLWNTVTLLQLAEWSTGHTLRHLSQIGRELQLSAAGAARHRPVTDAASAAPVTNVPPSTEIGRYRVLSLLGAGGMGQVYLAEDMSLGRRIALKILPIDSDPHSDRVRRFVQEARLASAISHPNIAQIFEIGDADGVHFIAMEYVEGETLGARLRSGPLPSGDVVDIALQTFDALDEAHARGIVHRDLKPANIAITPRGRVKVLDFGLATLARSHPASTTAATDVETNPGVILGRSIT